MLMTEIVVENRGGNGEDVVGEGFHEYFPGHETTVFIIADNLASDAVDTINAASVRLTASTGESTDVADNGLKPDAVDDDAIAELQSLGETGYLTVDGANVIAGVAVFDVPRKVTLTSDSDNSGVTVTIIGSDENGDAASEDITGPNAETVTSTGWFSTVTAIAVDAAITALKAGKGEGYVEIDLNNGPFQKIEIGANCTIGFTNWLIPEITDAIRILTDNSGGFVINWQADLVPGGTGFSIGMGPNLYVAKFLTPDGGITVIGMVEARDLSA